MVDKNGNGAVDANETSPCKKDTDNDRFSDYDEVIAGANPLDPASIPTIVCVAPDSPCDPSDRIVSEKFQSSSVGSITD